jgi:hypothetical protein
MFGTTSADLGGAFVEGAGVRTRVGTCSYYETFE